MNREEWKRILEQAEQNQIASGIFNQLTEGILIADLNGAILLANQAAADILEIPKAGMKGKSFASLFFDNPENDAFSQTVVDAFYAKPRNSSTVVSFHTEKNVKYLNVFVSVLLLEEKTAGFVIAMTDLSELMELRDSAQDMARVSRMNRQLTARNELLQKTFGMYVSDDVVSELLDRRGKVELGGKKQNLTIMMSDLRGFTALCEQMGADDLIAMLNHYLAVMTGVIQKYNGTIIEFIGDGILAIFGAPIPSEMHAADAAAAAVEMQASMSKINQWNVRRGYPRLEMGIGLNTGEAIVGNVGSKKRVKYGVVGSLVNLCGRIESYTTGGQILISESMRAAIPNPLTIERELLVRPKGVSGEQVLFHVTGIGEPYNVSIKVKNDTPKALREPIPVYFSLIREKHTLEERHYAGITAIGRGTCVMETEVALNVYDNLQVQAGGRLLSKVLDVNSGSYLLQFTSIPAGFSDWVKARSI